MTELGRRIGRGVGGAALAAMLVGSGANAASDSCREWQQEHRRWKTEALGRYLRGAPQREVDAAVFEILQREAYLTSCETSVQGGRDELIGWRLIGRTPEEYGSAVIESLLERAGFDLDLRILFEGLDGPPGAVGAATARSRRDPAR